jgi:putative membrane protein
MSNSDKHMDKGVRLHKSSPLFILLMVVWKSIIPLFFGGVYYDISSHTQSIMVVAFIVIPSVSLLQYWFYHYWIKEDKIEIKEGIFFKKNRKIPYVRIQNVNVSQSPLHRLFNVATLQLESASGGKPEAVMRVVTPDVVEEIKNRVRLASSTQVNTDTDDDDDKVEQDESLLLDVNPGNIVKYGIISQKGMFFAAILFGFMAQNQSVVAWIFKYLNAFYEVPDFSHVTLAQGAIYVVVIGLLILVFLQVMSIIWALLKFYGFQIAKHGDRLQAHMGLLSKVSATIPLKRIQLYRISKNPLHKYFKASTITIETAGGVNTDKSGIVMRWLAPYIDAAQVKSFMHEIEPKIKIAGIDWQLLPARAWRRVFKRSLFMVALFSTILIAVASLPQVTLRVYAWALMVLMIPIAYFYSKNYIKKTAYYINDDIICFKSGVWFGKQSFVKISKVQTVEIHESPFDRRNNMATLEIDTAGSNAMLHHVRIPYLELSDAYKMRAFIQTKLKETEFDW